MQKLEIVREKIESKYRVVKSDVDLEWNRAIDLCMNIINAHISRENTPEITRSSRDNDGWVSVEDRTPEESGYYRVTVKDKELGDITEETAWFAYVDDYDMDESEWRELYEYEEVIAWRELAPYNPERSNDEKE